jgi:BASS family bile acid:Na+ symporter
MSDFTHPFFNRLAELTLFTLMLSLGLTVSFRQVMSLWQRPWLLNRAVIGMSVIVPILAVLIGLSMNLPDEVKVGLALVSISPGTSLPLQLLFSQVKGHLCLGALQLTAAVLSVMTIPLTLAIVNEFLPAQVQIAPFAVVQQLLFLQFLPLVIGVILHQARSALMEQFAKQLVIGATLLLGMLMIWILSQHFHTILHMGIRPVLAIGCLALLSLWIGHWIGGRETATRTLLALTLSSHNIALALFIAIANLPKMVVSPVIAVYVLMSAGLSILYSKWSKPKLAFSRIHKK